MHQTREELLALAELAKDGVNVRFIELMPIGQGKEKHTLKEAEVKHILSETYGTIRPCGEKLGSGPAYYRKIDGFEGKIGFISAISHKFCSGCNRVRMSRSGQNTEECRKLEASTGTQSLQVVGKAGFLNGKSKGCVHQ